MRTGSRRRLLTLVAVLGALAMTLAACGSEEDDNGTTGGGGPEEPQFETLEEGVLQVGSCLDYRPFEYFEKGSEEPTGFDVELTEAIAEQLGLEVEWVRADFDTIFTAVDAGQFDMVAAASTITPEREETVDFSDPYYNARQALSVQSGDPGSTDELGDGNTVGVQKGTTGAAWAKDNLEPNGVTIKTYTAVTDAFTDLEAGSVDGIINDEPSSAAEIENRPGLEIVESIDTDENYGFAFSKDNPDLTLAVNDALQAVIDDGTYQQIFEKYFPGTALPEEFAPSE
ncbi:MAG: basic amino acid ABC transporter substrate-binding protein [Actinomycetota bacterium]